MQSKDTVLKYNFLKVIYILISAKGMDMMYRVKILISFCAIDI